MTDQNPESMFVCFTEMCKKNSNGEDAVLHITIRDNDDKQGMARVDAMIAERISQGWEHRDVPKKSGWSGGNKGSGKPQRVEIKADGRFEVRALVKVNLSNKDNVKAIGVNGEDCIAWEGRALKEFLAKQAGVQPIQTAFSGWELWNLNEEHAVTFQHNTLFAQCTKAESGKWYVKEILVEPK